MAYGVLIHRTDSIYEDIPSERYQFPKQYLSRITECIGDWIVYLEPSKVKDTKGYFAIAKIAEIIPDPRNIDMFLAIIESGSYLDFGDPVPFRIQDQILERGLLNEAGNISGRAQSAARPISSRDFARIVELGLGTSDEVLPRIDEAEGFSEEQQTPYDLSPRDRITEMTSRVTRDRNFRKKVVRAYSETCAITGLRLINGGGRAEVEAAHIRPVEHDGPDIITNGIALSGTAHWMFDRGLVGLSNTFEILISRQANDAAAIREMINPSGSLLLPNRLSDNPRSEFIAWHQKHSFKR